MNVKKIFLGLLLMLLSMIAFANNKVDNSANVKNDDVYTENKTTVMVSAVHPVFVIKLKSNPTTGYSWFLREYNAALITPVKHSFHAAETQLMGAPGYELWSFQVKPAAFVVPHQTSIRMVYARPWQGNESSNQLVFRVTTEAKK